MSSESAFIMYSSKDSEAAAAFAEKLRNEGANIWIDTLDLLNLSEDQDEEEVMETALLSSKLVIVLTSKNALNDQFVRNDKRFAMANDKKLLLVTIEPCDLSKKMRWRNLPLVSLHKNEDEAIQKILSMVNVSQKAKASTKKAVPEKAMTETNESVISEPTESKDKPTADMFEKTLLNEIKEDIEFYKFKMQQQISQSKFYSYLGIGGAIVVACAAIFLIPDLVTKVTEVQDKIQWAGSLFGGGLPTTFGISSLTSTKEKKKRLEGVQLFERKISRIERGIVPLSKAEVLNLEDDFDMYINA